MGGTVSLSTASDAFRREQWTVMPSKSHSERISQIESSSHRFYQKLTFSKSKEQSSTAQKYFPMQTASNQTHLINKLTSQQVIEYQIQYDQEQYLENMHLFSFRQQNSECIIAPKYIYTQCIDEFCCKSYSLKIYIENISFRFSDIDSIPFRDSLYVLKNCLKGFQKIRMMIQNFQVYEELIGITSEAGVKVWIHSDFSRNQSMSSTQITHQSANVLKILQIIQKRTVFDQSTVSTPLDRSKSRMKSTKKIPKFSQFLHKNNKNQITFQYAIEMLDIYTRIICIQVPNYFISVLNRIRAEKGINESQIMDTDKIDRTKMKQSKVSRVLVEPLKFKTNGIYQSFMRSDSSVTYADLLNSWVSRNRPDKTKMSTMIKNSPTGSLELEGLVKSTKLIDSTSKLQKNEDDKYFGRYINLQQSIANFSNFKKIEEEEQMNRSRSILSQKSKQSSRQDMNTKSQINAKANRITFTYHDSNTIPKLQTKPPSINIQKVVKGNKISDSEPMSIINTAVTQQKTANGDRYTNDDDLELDPQILADMHKYAIGI